MFQKDIVLIDEPLENDHRVLSIIKQYDNPLVVDCSQYDYEVPHITILILKNIWTLLYAIVYSPVFWIKFYLKYGFSPDGLWAGLKKSLETKYTIDKTFNTLSNQYKNYTINTIHANDLTCGLIGLQLSKKLKCHLIYDAHELEFHRNRRNSLLRVVYDMLLEKRVISSSTKVIVVNKPILNVYNTIYTGLITSIESINNNHFTPYCNYTLDTFDNSVKEVSVLYIGAAIHNRMLKRLTKESLQYNIKVYGFFLKNTPTKTIDDNWVLGGRDYLPQLLKIIPKQRLTMWCCADNLCLSYKLGLANKFFQAIAVGIPIIAYKDTYLAEIVQKYNIGYIYNDTNFEEILNALKATDTYYSLLQSVASFQKKLFIDKLEL